MVHVLRKRLLLGPALLGVFLLAPGRAFCAATQSNNLRTHDHSNANNGGSTLRPATLVVSTITATNFSASTMTVTSTFTVLGTSRLVGNVTFVGSVLNGTYTPSSFKGNNIVHLSSCTAPFTYTDPGPLAHNFGPAISTVTVSLLASSKIRVTFSGMCGFGVTSGSNFGLSYLVDGAFDTGYDATTGVTGALIPASGQNSATCSFSVITPGTFAVGAHTIALTSMGNDLISLCSQPNGTINYKCQLCAEALQ